MAAPSTPVFTDQTLRQIVHASAGGSTVRVRLSNAYGDDALFVGAAHVAVRARGPRLVAGTDRVLAFAGRASVSIPRGAVALSDPVELDVPALGDLAVSIYVPRATAGATVHSLGSDTNYILDGDRAGAEDPAISSTTLAVYMNMQAEIETVGQLIDAVGKLRG